MDATWDIESSEGLSSLLSRVQVPEPQQIVDKQSRALWDIMQTWIWAKSSCAPKTQTLRPPRQQAHRSPQPMSGQSVRRPAWMPTQCNACKQHSEATCRASAWATTASPASAFCHWCTCSSAVNRVPWQYRMSHRQYQDIIEARASRALRVRSKSSATRLPCVEALAGEAFDKQVLDICAQSLASDLGLRTVDTHELLQADRKLWN